VKHNLFRLLLLFIIVSVISQQHTHSITMDSDWRHEHPMHCSSYMALCYQLRLKSFGKSSTLTMKELWQVQTLSVLGLY